ncbi:MAG: L,D-transpeptidase family protein [Candidatus Peribacteraceae bacterium]
MPFSLQRFFRLLSCVVLLSAVMPLTASAQGTLLPQEVPPTPLEEWQAQPGDDFVVDTKENMGYLMHRDGGYVAFPVVTGQRRTVRYIGRTYDAATPNRSWMVLSKETKGDRITFGKLGTFFRLFKHGSIEETSYGIHAHANGDTMLRRTDRYRSMGCIIVSDVVLSIIAITYARNGNVLPVTTVYGLSSEIVTYPVLLEAMKMENKKGL